MDPKASAQPVSSDVARLAVLAEGLVLGAGACGQDRLLVFLSEDLGRSVGRLVTDELELMSEVVILDGVRLEGGEFVDIGRVKDVPGIMTADPRLVPDARVIPQLHHREAAEVAHYVAAGCAATTYSVTVERLFLAKLGEGCHTAFACHHAAGRVHLFRADFGRRDFAFPVTDLAAASALADDILRQILPR